ncbi:MAG: ACP S-malonyltransferase [Devosiaceae bacterium]|nr:ACP S-malonyltransferase [Devosiaceae bacterium]
MGKTAFTFPGQGSQAIGMGQELAKSYKVAKQVFEQVDEALNQNLSKIMFEGNDDELRLTENAQPALLAVSMAVIRVLEEKGISIENNASFVAGHSLGEYSALCAAGTFSLSDAARLLKTRGQAMQQAVPVGQGAMAAILGLEFDDVIEVAKQAAQGAVCEIANDNANGQVVISGNKEAIERAIELAKAKGAKRALLLPVSAPFHCSLMCPAAEKMEEALALVNMQSPIVPLVCNVLAKPISEPSEIRKRLVEQVSGMVRWRQSVEWLTNEGEVTQLVELGAGKVLSGLAKRINREVKSVSLNTPEQIEAFALELKS